MTTLELWRPVVGYLAYEVSSLGRVRSSLRGGRILRPGASTRFGHMSVVLGRGNTRLVHSLVMAAFVGPRPDGADILHLDGNARNNDLTNLKYGSRSENNRQIVFDGNRKLSAAQVRALRQHVWQRGDAPRLAVEYGVSVSSIYAICREKRYYQHV